MNSTWLARLGLGLAIFLVSANSAPAQRPIPYAPPNYRPGYRPRLSPYLNLLRSGDPAANYFLGTRPEIQRRANVNRFDLRTRQLGIDILQLSRTQQDLIQPRPAEADADLYQPVIPVRPGLGGTGGLATRARRDIVGAVQAPSAFSNTGPYFDNTGGYFGNLNPRRIQPARSSPAPTPGRLRPQAGPRAR